MGHYKRDEGRWLSMAIGILMIVGMLEMVRQGIAWLFGLPELRALHVTNSFDFAIKFPQGARWLVDLFGAMVFMGMGYIFVLPERDDGFMFERYARWGALFGIVVLAFGMDHCLGIDVLYGAIGLGFVLGMLLGAKIVAHDALYFGFGVILGCMAWIALLYGFSMAALVGMVLALINGFSVGAGFFCGLMLRWCRDMRARRVS